MHELSGETVDLWSTVLDAFNCGISLWKPPNSSLEETVNGIIGRPREITLVHRNAGAIHSGERVVLP